MGQRGSGGQRRVQWRLAVLLPAAFILAVTLGSRAFWAGRAAAEPDQKASRPAVKVMFSAADPAGDDAGAGGLTYPTHQAFEPHTGLFDLRHFRVSVEDRLVHVDLTFGALTNPFSAPEGFYHQRVDVYFVTPSREGSTEPFQPGPKVQFHGDYPWSMRLRVAPFGGTRLHTYQDPRDSPGRSRGINVGVQPDGKTIRVTLPVELLGIPRPDWRYYVLVGGYDHFGEDEWRDVVGGEDPWAFGGATDAGATPRVLDVLAPGRGWYSQRRQLGSIPRGGVYPVVSPVPASGSGIIKGLVALAAASLVGGAGWRFRHLWRRPRRQ